MAPAGSKVDPRVTRKLIDRWKASKDSAERNDLEKSLREVLKAEFSMRLEAHEKEIKQLEEKVRQLRDRLNLRREKQDEIVDHRLQQLLRDAQGLGWGAEGAGGQAIYQYWQANEMGANAPADDLFGRVEPMTPLDPQPTVSEGATDVPATSDSDLFPARN
jgi:hypothetical protein